MTLTELLAPFGLGQDEFVDALSRELRATPDSSASRLTESEQSLLQEHGGIAGPIGDDVSVRRGTLDTSSSNLAKLTRESLAVGQAATLLGVDGSRVRHRARDRALYAFKIGGSLRLPAWQFEGRDPIPGLRPLIATLPLDLHPLEVGGFMATANAGLIVGDEPTSPREWLIGGGDVRVIVELLEHLDAW